MTEPLLHTLIDGKLGETILENVQRATGCECHFILMVIPRDEDGNAGIPGFFSTLAPEIVRDVIIDMADNFEDDEAAEQKH